MPVIVEENSACTRVLRRNKIILSRRESNDADRTQSIFETRGRTQRSAPTRRFVIRPSTIKHLHLTTRRRVECGAGVPGAGHFSLRGLQASEHSAFVRAGTVHDGHDQKTVKNSPVVTIGDGRPTRPHHTTDQPSRTEHQTGFS